MEDERIRKNCIHFLELQKSHHAATFEIEECIAWLENQCKEEYALKLFKDEDVRKLMQYIEKEAKAYEFNLPNRGYDIYAFAKDILAWFEKQCEQKPIMDVEIPFGAKDSELQEALYYIPEGFHAKIEGNKVIIKKGAQKPADNVEPKFKVGDTMRTLQEADDGYTDGMPVVVSIDNEYYHCTNELIAIKDQDDYEFPPINVKQKSADKVEPKFHEGDWIIFNGLILHINEVVQGYYRTTSINGIPNSYDWDIDNVARLWTIQEAKTGDVLAVDSMPFIYNGSKNEVTVGAYCGFNAKHKFSFAYNYVINQNITPATKEQRELLFSKMKEAGYKWDDKKI